MTEQVATWLAEQDIFAVEYDGHRWLLKHNQGIFAGTYRGRVYQFDWSADRLPTLADALDAVARTVQADAVVPA